MLILESISFNYIFCVFSLYSKQFSEGEEADCISSSCLSLFDYTLIYLSIGAMGRSVIVIISGHVLYTL